MPNIDLVEILKITFKLIVIGLLFSLFIGYIVDIRDILGDLLIEIGASTSSLNGVDLGCVGDKLGFKDFLNTLVDSVFIAGNFLLSGVATIFGFKYGIELYKFLIKI